MHTSLACKPVIVWISTSLKCASPRFEIMETWQPEKKISSYHSQRRVWAWWGYDDTSWRERRGRKCWLEKRPHVWVSRRKKKVLLALAVLGYRGSAGQPKVSAWTAEHREIPSALLPLAFSGLAQPGSLLIFLSLTQKRHKHPGHSLDGTQMWGKQHGRFRCFKASSAG